MNEMLLIVNTIHCLFCWASADDASLKAIITIHEVAISIKNRSVDRVPVAEHFLIYRKMMGNYYVVMLITVVG